MIEHTKLEDVVKNVEICFDPDDLNTLIDEDKDLIEQYQLFENIMNECLENGDTECIEKTNSNMVDTNDQKSKWIIRIQIDEEKLLEKNITMDDIHFALKNSYSETINCIYSDYNSSKLIFRIRLINIKQTKKKATNVLDQTDQIYMLKNFQEQLLSIVLKGVNNIDKVILRKIKDNVREVSGVFKKQETWVLDTVGTNLMEILSLNYIDKKRTFSNDIVETLNVLGIEAARQTILNELSEVLEFDGAYINYHHLSLLVDRMTYTHKIISVFRHGINNDDIGPIAKASFEETNEMFIKASKHAELDIMKGVSACIMCGQEGYYGTSSFQLVLDMDKMLTLQETTNYKSQNEEDEIERMFNISMEEEKDICSMSNIKIENNVSNIGITNMGQVKDDYELF
jgi:DNA-directed RNA polymerase II subunit RPB1